MSGKQGRLPPRLPGRAAFSTGAGAETWGAGLGFLEEARAMPFFLRLLRKGEVLMAYVGTRPPKDREGETPYVSPSSMAVTSTV